MKPITFPESNVVLHPPELGLRMWHGYCSGGKYDGEYMNIVAWKPTPDEVKAIVEGAPVFLSVVGELPNAHILTTNFAAALSPENPHA